ncbi:MAG: YceI family protein [Balneolaceae bacterium]
MNFRKLIIPLQALFLVFAGGIVTATAQVQDTTSLQLQPEFTLTINGTSNVRDWDANVETVNADFRVVGITGVAPQDLDPGHFHSLGFRIPVEDIDSGNRRLTNNIQDYLKGDDHPTITFTLSDITAVEQNEEGTFLQATGVLNAAGGQTTLNTDVKVVRTGNGTLLFSGSHTIKMTDVGISPPTVLLGTIRAADEVTITWSLPFGS